MGNLFYDFDPGFFGLGPSFVQPYVGGGVGYAFNHRLDSKITYTPDLFTDPLAPSRTDTLTS